MRRLSVLLLVCLVLLTGCGKSSPTPITDGFRCTVMLDYEGTVYEGVLLRTAPQSGELTLTSPASVKDLCMAWSGEEVSLSYSGISLKVDEKALPIGAAIKVLCRSLDACSALVAAGEIATIIEGEHQGVPFSVSFDEQTGYPKQLSLPSADLTVTFLAFETAESAI